MATPIELFFAIVKATYLFTRESQPKKGGDKQKFWKEVLSFSSPEGIRDAILKGTKVTDLEFQGVDSYGDRYQATIGIYGPTGVFRLVRTGWIVRHNEDIARFVTAVPEKSRG